MSTVTRRSAAGKLTIDGVSWAEYSRFLRAFQRRPSVRLTYDNGLLELMTISFEHDTQGRFLGRLVVTLTEELGLPILCAGSTTFRRQAKRRGLEADNSFWIASEARVRGRRKIDLRIDPPPDLAVEVDIAHSSLPRLSIYASLGVPEVWRYGGQKLTYYLLQPTGDYSESVSSPTFPGLRPGDLVRFLNRRQREEENTVIRQFRSWVRSRVAAGWR